MRPIVKALLIAEVVVCFVPLTLMLAVGAIMAPSQVAGFIDEPLEWEGPASFVGAVLCGIAGLSALTFVMARLLGGHVAVKRPTPIATGIWLGVTPILAAFTSPSYGWWLLAAAPLAVAAHIIFLSRRWLFPSSKAVVRSLCVPVILALGWLVLRTFPPFDISEADLIARKEMWLATRPNAYECTVVVAGWTDPELLEPKRITVRDEHVVSAEYAFQTWSHQQGERAPLAAAWTVDSIFDSLIAARRMGWSVRARFDRQLGFVEKAYLKIDRPNSGWDVEVRKFSVLEASPSPQ